MRDRLAHLSGLLVVGLLGSVVAGSAIQVGSVPSGNLSSAAPNHPSDSKQIETLVTAAYAREFGETILRPAIFIEPADGGCKNPHLTTTAYLRTSPASARLLTLYMSVDGATVIRKFQIASVVAPSGIFRVLVILVRHPATVRDADLENWEAAQAKINRDHASFASSRGLSDAIVSFANTNVFVDAAEITDPRSAAAVREAAERQGIATSTYQFIASINIDPEKSEGGFAGAAGFVYMGNYSRWSRPLTAAQWINVANAVYHHEVGHHWGWPGSHDWARQCRARAPNQPFIVPPVLFGWEDVDGDRIAEILDTTPYGRQP